MDGGISTANGGLTNNEVTITEGEDLTIEVYKGGEVYSFEKGQSLIEEGNYQVILTDKLGNKKEYSFTIIKDEAKTSIDYTFNEGIHIDSVTKDGQEITVEGNHLNFTEDGTYIANYSQDGKT